jgi:hypothetical protein
MAKTVLFIVTLCSAINLFSKGYNHQNDTIINNGNYQIIKIHSNGKVKLVGQYGYTCFLGKRKKHGEFICYNNNGKISKSRTFFFGRKLNRKILGLKIGRWGFYGIQNWYFFGIQFNERIIDPCVPATKHI